MASNYLLEIEGLKGESQNKAVAGGIEIDQFSWGVSNPVDYSTGGGGGRGKASFSEFSFSKKIDASSAPLTGFCFDGSPFKATLHVFKQGDKSGPVEYLKITLTEAGVSNYHANGSGGEGDVFETYTLGFAQVEMEYTDQSAKNTKGSNVKAGWNVKTGEAV